ncbi:MAG: GAF domain-containing protein [Thermoleophilia bacterium]|nr:GAF domain-containing protein [Thermoleophilia bacterium]
MRCLSRPPRLRPRARTRQRRSGSRARRRPRQRQEVSGSSPSPRSLPDPAASLCGRAWKDGRVRDYARQQALVEAGIALAAEPELDTILKKLLETAAALTGARYAALGVLGRGRRLERFISLGLDAAERAAIGDEPRGLGLLGAVIDESSSVRVDDIAADPRSVGFPPNHPQMRTFLGVPLRLRRGDDDGAVHPVRDVREHGLRAAVVHEHAWVGGAEAERERLARLHVAEGDVRGDPRRVEVDRVRDRAAVHERHLDGLPFSDVDDRAGGTQCPVECPDVVEDPRRNLDRFVGHHHPYLHHVPVRDRRERCRVRLMRLGASSGVRWPLARIARG